MEKQKTKSVIPKLAAGAGGAGLVAITLLTGGGDGTVQQTAVSVTPTAIVAEAVETSEPERTVSVTQELTPTGEVVFVATVTVAITPELTVTGTPTPEPSPTMTPMVVPSFIVTPTVTPTDTPTPMVTPTVVPTVTSSSTVTSTTMPTAAPTMTPVPTATPTVKPTATPTVTPMPTDTPTPTSTPKPTNTPRPTNTPKPTPTVTPSPTATLTPVPTATPSPIPKAWKEPKERKDIEELLMAKVNAYRESQGIRKFESGYVYDDAENPGMGEYLEEKGIRVAKECCLEHSANHEGGQIGTGIYWYPWQMSAEKAAGELYDNWYNSKAHNRNLLTDHSEIECVDVAAMTVVEYFDGEDWHYCAIMTSSCVPIENLPEGLK